MTIERRADLVLPPVLGELAGNTNPDYLDDVLVATSHMRQRRTSASLQRWLPTVDTAGASWLGPRIPWRGLAVALVILALLVASLALVAGANRKQYAPAFGLAETGLVAFASGDDIVATLPDGTGRRTLITGDGVQWGPIWSHRGDRFGYWSATPAKTDPPSLWAADRDGSNPHLVAGDLTSEQADVFPASSWSPDDQRLAFADAGVLYVVNADGTGLHRVGDGSHQRGTPVWSPDGSLIAYQGNPLNDPDNNNSLWVITPAGLNDQLVIPSEGGYEIGVNTNPSWSPDSQSLLVHTGGANETGPPNSISIAQRNPAGVWLPWRIVTGSTWNYLPAWSTTGTQFTFLRAVDGAEEEYLVMVANADGTNVLPLSTRHVALATPCWTPDDLFIRAFSLRSGTVPTITLFPLDGTQPVDIPGYDGGPSAGCYPQRLAP